MTDYSMDESSFVDEGAQWRFSEAEEAGREKLSLPLYAEMTEALVVVTETVRKLSEKETA